MFSLFIYLIIYIFVYLFVYSFILLFIYLFVYLFVYSFFSLFIYISLYIYINISIYLYISSFVYLFVYLFPYLFVFSYHLVDQIYVNTIWCSTWTGDLCPCLWWDFTLSLGAWKISLGRPWEMYRAGPNGKPRHGKFLQKPYMSPYYWVDEFVPYYMEIMGV